LVKIAVCDDEQCMLSELMGKIYDYLKCTNRSGKVFPFSNAESLLKSKETFDIIFLDINLDGLSGMEAAQKLREAGSECYIVFVTVLKECVYDAFNVDASDYLLKPLDGDRLKHTMVRIFRYIENQAKNSLTIQKGMWYKSIQLSDVFYCEAINRKIYVHTKEDVIDYYFKIEDLEKILQSGFFRCHRSYLVNLQYVCGCENGMAELENGEKLPISRLRQQDFVQALLCYMKDSL